MASEEAEFEIEALEAIFGDEFSRTDGGEAVARALGAYFAVDAPPQYPDLHASPRRARLRDGRLLRLKLMTDPPAR